MKRDKMKSFMESDEEDGDVLLGSLTGAFIPFNDKRFRFCTRGRTFSTDTSEIS